MARVAAFLDACVLVSIVPCDTLLRLGERGLFRPLWSSRVEGEALAAIAELRPDLGAARIRRRFEAMNDSFPDASVEDWEPLVDGISLPDPDDRHVVAAAIRGRADVIVTENLKDFPESALKPFGLQAVGIDRFLLDQYNLDRLVRHVCWRSRPLRCGGHPSRWRNCSRACRATAPRHSRLRSRAMP